MHLTPPVTLAGGESVVVDSLLIVTPIVGFCNCFVVRYFVSILVLQSS